MLNSINWRDLMQQHLQKSFSRVGQYQFTIHLKRPTLVKVWLKP